MKKAIMFVFIFLALPLQIYAQYGCNDPERNPGCYYKEGAIFEPTTDGSHLCSGDGDCVNNNGNYYACISNKVDEMSGISKQKSSSWWGPFSDTECTIPVGSSEPVYIMDLDNDGVPDEFDECPETPASHLLNFNIDDTGCPFLNDFKEGTCNHLGGSGSNVNIVLLPCNYPEGKGNRFAAFANEISSMFLNDLVPFNKDLDKYSIYYVTDASFYNENNCDVGNRISDYLATVTKICKSELSHGNIILAKIAHNHLTGIASIPPDSGGIGVAVIPEGMVQVGNTVVYVGDTSFAAAHEIGHTFRLGHSFGYLTLPDKIETSVGDYVYDTSFEFYDYYFPSLGSISDENIYLTEPCPIWNPKIYPAFDDFLDEGETIGCYPGYLDFIYFYSPMPLPLNKAKGDIMTGHFKKISEYNPVQRALIKQALDNGYQTYINGNLNPQIPILHKCEDDTDETRKTQCLTEACRYVAESQKNLCCKGIPHVSDMIYQACKTNLDLT